MINIHTFDLEKYNATYTEMVEWAREQNIMIYRAHPAMATGDAKTLYGFENAGDVVAFSIRFGRSTMPSSMKPKSTIPRGPCTI